MDDLQLHNEMSSSPFFDKSKLNSISLMDVARISEDWLQVKKQYLTECEANLFLTARQFGEKNVEERLDILLEYHFQKLQSRFSPVTIAMPEVTETVGAIDFKIAAADNAIQVTVTCNEEEPHKLRSPDEVLSQDLNHNEALLDNHEIVLATTNIEDEVNESSLQNPEKFINEHQLLSSDTTVPVVKEAHDLRKRCGLVPKRSIPNSFIDTKKVIGTFVKKRQKWQEELRTIQLPPLIRDIIDHVDEDRIAFRRSITSKAKPVQIRIIELPQFLAKSQHYHAHNYNGRSWAHTCNKVVHLTEADEKAIAKGFIANLEKCSITELLRYKHLIKGYIEKFVPMLTYIRSIDLPAKPPWKYRDMASTTLLS